MSKIKKTLSVVAAVGLSMSLMSCSQVKDVIDTATGGVETAIDGAKDLGDSFSSAKSDNIYSELDSLIKNPNSTYSDTLKNFEFKTLITSEAYETEFDDEPGKVYWFQNAMISRNLVDGFMLEVKEGESYPVGSIVKVKGDIGGFVYTTIDNNVEEILHVVANKVDVVPEEDFRDAEQSNKIVINDGIRDAEINIIAAYGVEGDSESMIVKNGEIVVYFDYTNNSSSDNAPRSSDFGSKYFGDYKLDISIINYASFVPEADRIKMDTFVTDTYAGKTFKYYMILTQESKSAEDVGESGPLDFSLPMEFKKYDDEFNVIVHAKQPVIELDRDDADPSKLSQTPSQTDELTQDGTQEEAEAQD